MLLYRTQLLLQLFAVDLGRLGIVKWLQLANMLFSLASCPNTILFGFDRALSHFEAVHCHMHFIVRLVPHLRLRRASSSTHLGAWILLLFANVRYSRIVVLPERLNTGLVLALV